MVRCKTKLLKRLIIYSKIWSIFAFWVIEYLAISLVEFIYNQIILELYNDKLVKKIPLRTHFTNKIYYPYKKLYKSLLYKILLINQNKTLISHIVVKLLMSCLVLP